MKVNNMGIGINLGSDTEFRSLFNSFYIPLCIFAARYVDDKDLAADIVQETFIKLWQIRNEFYYLHQVKSFLYTSVRNKSLNEIEHSKVVNEYAEKVIKKKSEGFFHDQVIEEETYRILTTAIEQLPKQMKAIMYLALEGMTNNQIAENLSVSQDTVKSLKKVAYRKLRDILREYYYLISFLV